MAAVKRKQTFCFPPHSGFFVNFLDTVYSGNFQTLCLISQAFLPTLLDEHSTRIDFRTLYRSVYCVWLSKKKKESKFPTGTEHVSNNIDFISFGNPQEYLVLL